MTHCKALKRDHRLCVTLSTALLVRVNESNLHHRSESAQLRKLITDSIRLDTVLPPYPLDRIAYWRRLYRAVTINCTLYLAEQLLSEARAHGITVSEMIECHCWRSFLDKETPS